MNSASGSKKLGSIIFVIDERLSRDRRAILARVVTAARKFATVQVMDGETTEELLLKKLQSEPASLIVAPWYRYLSWTKVEAFYGLTRNSGPTFAGYFCEPMQAYELGEQGSQMRTILLDFANLSALEAAKILETLIKDSRRTGIRPLLDPNSSIYCENWYMGQGLGLRIDNLMALPEIANSEWSRRASAIRIIMSALWSLIYEEGPGKSELTQAITGNKSPRAYLQLGCDNVSLIFRLCYTMPGWSSKNALDHFWPDAKSPTSPAQLLIKYSDFLRVHTVTENSDVEVVIALFNSSVAEKAHEQLHTFWIEPVSANLVTEVPFEAPGPHALHLKALPVIPELNRVRAAAPPTEDTLKTKERFIFDAAVKIRELKAQLSEREELIRDMRAGGVGTAQPLSIPDAESLLEAFQERYFEARYQIRQFEIQIQEMEKNGASPQEVEALRLKMSALAARENSWIKKIAATLENFRAAKG